jgi:hypothetical protein
MKMTIISKDKLNGQIYLSAEITELDSPGRLLKRAPIDGEIVSQFPTKDAIYLDILLKEDVSLEAGDEVSLKRVILKEQQTTWEDIQERAKAFASQIHKNGVHRYTYAQAVRHVLETQPELYRRYRAEQHGSR